MAAQRQDFKGANAQMRGDTWTFNFAFTAANGSPVSVNGYQFWMTLKLDPSVADSEATLQKTLTSADDTGTVAIVFDPADTEDVMPSTYNYDVQQSVAGAVTTIMHGKIKVLADVTRSR